MINKKSSILIISPESWNSHFVSKHHYAITLASKGNNVYFLNPPDNKLTTVEIQNTDYSNLRVISSPKIALGLRFYPKLIRTYLEKRWLENIEKIINLKFTIIWNFENSRFYDMQFASNRLKIYHQVDLNQNYHVSSISLSCDICLCTSDFIMDKLLKYNDCVYKIHHGYSLQLKNEKLTHSQLDLFVTDTVNVVLVGNLEISYLDIELIYLITSSFPEITFHFVGGYSTDGNLYLKCNKLLNIVWWGKVDSKLIPSILKECDIQLVAYKARSSFDKQQLANPHKIMEYLASGKISLITYTDEYKDKRHLVEMVDNSNAYMSKFNYILKNLDLYNSQVRQDERTIFAKQHSYEKQLEKINNILIKCSLT